ncbi:tandem-95 repeat protein [Aestuariispira insulae]|uniref:VCBS repeat-containing protein n=1 Tax=Aestuariispira insulae TaxID=1461337 RepID=A0A3D9HQ76_9PROT|nr:Ig-like domain-containing protein [Aestuariispira insulae]RED51620.1 VCBS repeat-containing protein [Aestuariispira insulae]
MINGGSLHDVIDGGTGHDVIQGFAGNDTITGDSGNDTLMGGAGDDNLDGGADDDLLIGGAGADVLTGGLGSDTASYEDAGAGVTANLADASGNTGDAAGDSYTGIENLTGSDFDDILTGDAGDNVITGGAGNDTIDGGAGTDTAVFSGNSTDYTITTDAGVTTVSGTDGTDLLTNVEYLLFDDGPISTNPNTAPVAADDADGITEDTAPNPVTGNVLVNDSDADGDSFNVSQVNGDAGNVGTSLTGSYGSLLLLSDGSYAYTLDNSNSLVQALGVGESLTEAFTYTIDDGNGGSDQATLTVTINGSNDGPVAVADSNSVTEDSAPNPVTGNVLTNDSDVDGDSLSVSQVSGAAGNVGNTVSGNFGSLLLLADGSYAYTLDNGNALVQSLGVGESLTDSFTYTVDDGNGGTDQTTLTITINGSNDGPVAAADANSIVEDGALNPVSGNVLTNDDDVDGDSLAVSQVNGATGNVGVATAGSFGSVVIQSGGDYHYTLDNANSLVQSLGVGESLTDSFTYTIDDGNGGTAQTTLTITITGSNDAPVVSGPVSHVTAEDTAITLTEAQLLANASDVDGDDLSVVGPVTASNGTVTDNGDDTWTFEPDADFNGTMDLSYAVSDGTVTTAATGTITVTAVNDAPMAGDVDLGETPEDTALTITAAQLLANSTDVDGDDLTVTAVTVNPALGTIVASGDDWIFTPATDLSDADVTFSFTISDGSLSDSATAVINVTPVNDAPVIGDVGPDVTFTEGDAPLLLDADLTVTDVDSTSLFSATVSIGGYVAGEDILTHGSLPSGVSADFDAATGVLTFSGEAPLADYQDLLRSIAYENTSEAPDVTARVISYQVNDGTDDSEIASLNVNLVSVNDGDPEALGGRIVMPAPETVSHILHGADVDGAVTFSLVSGPANGSVTVNADGTYTYHPAGFTGTDNFTYRVEDSDGVVTQAVMQIEIGDAAPDSGGAEEIVNSYGTDFQSDPAIASLEDGGWVVTWSSDGQDGSAEGIYAQRYGFDGHKVGSEFQVNTFTSFSQDLPDAAGLTDGGYVIVWQSNDQNGSPNAKDVYLQRYDADGNKVDGETLVNTDLASDDQEPRVTGLANGGYVVTWWSAYQDADSRGVYAQMFNADGIKTGGEFLVNSYETYAQDMPDITALSDGGFVVVWQSNDQNGSSNAKDVYLQRYDADGNKVGDETLVNTDLPSDDQDPQVTGLANGSYVVTWWSAGQDADGRGVFAQVFDADGNKVGGEFQVNQHETKYQDMPAVTALTDGGFVIVWQSNDQNGSSNGRDVYLRRYDADGNAQTDEILVNADSQVSDDQNAQVAALRDGGYVVTWWSGAGEDGSGRTIQQRVFSGSGEKLDGTDGNDVLIGDSGGDTIDGSGGDDLLTGNVGDDIIDGGDGDDIAVFNGNRTDYVIEDNGDGTLTVRDLDAVAGGDDGTDTVSNVETLRFADGDAVIDPANSGPEALGGKIVLPEAEAVSHILHGTDVDAGDSLTFELIEGPANGTVTVNADGTYSYDPAGFTGTDSFTYRVTDSHGYSSDAVMEIESYDGGREPENSDDFAKLVNNVGGGTATLSENGTRVISTNDTTVWYQSGTEVPTTGKTYIEMEPITINGTVFFGFRSMEGSTSNLSQAVWVNDGRITFIDAETTNAVELNDSLEIPNLAYTSNDRVGMAYDAETGNVEFYRNGSLVANLTDFDDNYSVASDGLTADYGTYKTGSDIRANFGANTNDGQTGFWYDPGLEYQPLSGEFNLNQSDFSGTDGNDVIISDYAFGDVNGGAGDDQLSARDIQPELTWKTPENGEDIDLGADYLTVRTGSDDRIISNSVLGKGRLWYWEVTHTGGNQPYKMTGIANRDYNTESSSSSDSATNAVVYHSSGELRVGAAVLANFESYDNNDVISVAFSPDEGLVWFAKNGVWQNGDPHAGTGGTAVADDDWYAMFGTTAGSHPEYAKLNFGQEAFQHTAPVNYLADGTSLDGGSGNDTLTGNVGDDIIDGGDGEDIAIFNGIRADYVIEDNGDGTINVRDLDAAAGGDDGTDTVSNVETLRFADGDEILDPANRGPKALGGRIVLPEAEVVSHILHGTDADADDSLTFKLVDGPANGSVIVNADGTYTYDPAGFEGNDSFTYRVTDSHGYSRDATVEIAIGELLGKVYGSLDETIARFGGNGSLSDGNLSYTGSGIPGADTYSQVWLEHSLSGQSYWETVVTAESLVGEGRVGSGLVASDFAEGQYGSLAMPSGMELTGGHVGIRDDGLYVNDSLVYARDTLNDPTVWQAGARCQYAFDAKTGALRFGVNGSWWNGGEAVATLDSSLEWFPAVYAQSSSDRIELVIREDDWQGTDIPAGYDEVHSTKLYANLDENIARYGGYGSLSNEDLTYTGSGADGAATYSQVWLEQRLSGLTYWETEIEGESAAGRVGSGLVASDFTEGQYGSLAMPFAGLELTGGHVGVRSDGLYVNDTLVYAIQAGDASPFGTGTIHRFAYDADSGELRFGVGDDWWNSADAVATLDTRLDWFPALYAQSANDSITLDLQETTWNYSPLAGYEELSITSPMGILAGTDGNDVLVGDDGVQVIDGGAGDDRLRNGSGIFDAVYRGGASLSDTSGYLERAASADGNRQTWTFAAWVKPSLDETFTYLFGVEGGSTNSDLFSIKYRKDLNQLDIDGFNTLAQVNLGTGANRDPLVANEWVHLTVTVDLTASDPAEQLKIAFDGAEQTVQLNDPYWPGEGGELAVNMGGRDHVLGIDPYGTSPSGDVVLADVHLVDGTALDSGSFGEMADGSWDGRDYDGEHGGNGFHLAFDGSGELTSDSAGNGGFTEQGSVFRDQGVLDRDAAATTLIGGDGDDILIAADGVQKPWLKNGVVLDGDANYLSRTSNVAGDRSIFTLSTWASMARDSQFTYLYGVEGTDNSSLFSVKYRKDLNQLDIGGFNTFAYVDIDLPADEWFHLVLSVNTGATEQADQIRIYIDGVQQTVNFNASWPVAGGELGVNKDNSKTVIGVDPYGSDTSGSVTEANIELVDGQALDADSFGAMVDGEWIAKEFAGEYGNNGFNLEFADDGSIISDSSGTGNDFTINGTLELEPDTDVWKVEGSEVKLVGDTGNDTLTGGSGADIYLISEGSGQDLITNADASDKVLFGAGITEDEVWFARQGDDLVVRQLGSTDKVTVADWYDAATPQQVGSLELADGQILSAANVQSLVDAMSAFTVADIEAGTVDTDPDYTTEFQTLVASKWS